MAKSKPATKPVKGNKAISAVKNAAVTKPAQAPKAKSKAIAKDTAKKVSKKAKEPESSEEEDSDVSDSSDSEASDSDSDGSESESVADTKKAVSNGKAKGKTAKDDSSDDDSDSGSDSDSDSSEDEAETKAAKPAVNGKAKVNGTSAKPAESDDSSDESDSSADEAPAKAKKANAANDDDDDDSDDSDSSESDEEPKKAAADSSDSESDEDSSASSDSDEEMEDDSAPKKRKAEEVATPQPKKQKSEAEDSTTSKNLFVGSLSWNVDDEWLRREFEPFGEIIRANVMTDRDSGRSRGFGYVEFTNLEDAVKAHKEMTGASIDDRNINVDFSIPRDASTPNQRQQQRGKTFGDQPSEPSATLFVGNISFDATEDILTEEFNVHAQVQSVRMPTRPEDGAPKGFGYVTFGSVEEATKAFEAMQGAYIANRPIRLDYSTPKPPRDNDSPRGGFGGRGRGRGDFGGRGRGDFGGRGRGNRGGPRGGRGNFNSTNRGGFGAASGKKISF